MFIHAVSAGLIYNGKLAYLWQACAKLINLNILVHAQSTDISYKIYTTVINEAPEIFALFQRDTRDEHCKAHWVMSLAAGQLKPRSHSASSNQRLTHQPVPTQWEGPVSAPPL